MSWHYLQDQEAVSWEGSSLDGAPCALLNLMPMHERYCLRGNATGALNRSRSGTMCEPSTESRGGVALMSCPVDSLVKTSALQTIPQTGLKGNGVDFGPKCEESFVKYDPGSRSWKTAQLLLFGGLAEYSETWPKWGLMRNGACFRLPMLEHDTCANACGSWPTPTKWEEKYIKSKSPGDHYHGIGWILWNTHNLQPTPEVYEAMMDWPIGWNRLQDAATDRFQEWFGRHGRF